MLNVQVRFIYAAAALNRAACVQNKLNSHTVSRLPYVAGRKPGERAHLGSTK